MKLYESIKRPDNYSKYKEPFVKGEKIQIQEKLDGSNLSIMKDNDKLRVFSRTREITGNYTDFKGLEEWLNEHENIILETLENGNVIFGEWLGQAKIPYNKKAGKGEIERYYMFDMATSIDNMDNEEKIDRHYVPLIVAFDYATRMGIPFVPIINAETILNTFEELVPTYVENQKSLLDSECIREGIVVKTLDGKKRVKIVGKDFSEVKSRKTTKTKSPYDFLDKYITPMRIQKFLMKVAEKEHIEEFTKEEYKLIFKNLDLLSEDILEEELEAIKNDLNRIIKKQSINAIKEYLEQ